MCDEPMTDDRQATALSVVVPIFNERENVPELVRRLDDALGSISWEVIFVDDASPDGSAEVVRRLARTDRRVRLISRHDRRGLSSAVVEGALAASASCIAVMDGDLQHDESVLPDLYGRVARDGFEIASASRFLTPEGASGLSSDARRKLSTSGIDLVNRAFGLGMSDPLTGFFVFRREVLERALPNLSGVGFKILLDLIVASEPKPRVVELPFRFRQRLNGASKLDNRAIYDFMLFFIEKKLGRWVPVPARFLSFAMINSVGILVHLAALSMLMGLSLATFASAQLAATVVSMGFNYTVNNTLTYRDRQLKGIDFYTGFVIFAALCSVGVVSNVGVASMLHKEYPELIYLLPAVAGAMITVVWNYAATRVFVWGRQRRLARVRPSIRPEQSLARA